MLNAVSPSFPNIAQEDAFCEQCHYFPAKRSCSQIRHEGFCAWNRGAFKFEKGRWTKVWINSWSNYGKNKLCPVSRPEQRMLCRQVSAWNQAHLLTILNIYMKVIRFGGAGTGENCLHQPIVNISRTSAGTAIRPAQLARQARRHFRAFHQ